MGAICRQRRAAMNSKIIGIDRTQGRPHLAGCNIATLRLFAMLTFGIDREHRYTSLLHRDLTMASAYNFVKLPLSKFLLFDTETEVPPSMICLCTDRSTPLV